MKKITAYINTVRVHWLVEELEALGIAEIMVTEYFSPSSKISRMELLSRDDEVELVRESVHRVGTIGAVADHCFFVEEYNQGLPSQIPLGKRTSKLEESRIKQLINFMLRGSHRRIRSAFLLMTISVLGVALFIGLRTNEIQLDARRTVETVRLLSEASSAMESGVLEEMLAVERFHRGEATDALSDFKRARVKVIDAVSDLEESQAVSKSTFDVLTNLEHRFHLIAGGMFDVVERLSNEGKRNHQQERAELFVSHNLIMSSLDSLRLRLLDQLDSFGSDTRELLAQQQREMNRSAQEVRTSLLLLAGVAIVLTTLLWLMLERKVNRPIRKLVEEANIIDTGVVK